MIIFTSADDALLKAELRKGGDWPERCAARVGTSSGSVRQRVRRLRQRGEITEKEWEAYRRPPRPQRPYTTVEVMELRRLFATDLTYAEIGQKLNRSLASVHQKCEALGLVRGHANRQKGAGHWPERDISYLHRALSDGATYKEIAEEMGRTPAAVVQKARSLGVEYRRRPWSKEEASLLRILFFSGMSDAAMGARLGRSQEAIKHQRRALHLSRGESP